MVFSAAIEDPAEDTGEEEDVHGENPSPVLLGGRSDDMIRPRPPSLPLSRSSTSRLSSTVWRQL